MDGKRTAFQRILPKNAAGSFELWLARAAPMSSAAEPMSPLGPGATLSDGRFTIVRRLGTGGMGDVYEARDQLREGSVALKMLSRVEPAGVYRLKHEFRGLAEVSHPNLVNLYELFSDGERWFFTMDLVYGQPFDTWVRPDRTLDLACLRGALPQLVAAIGALHDAGKVHCDLKPNNVLVTPEGDVLLLDFGLAADLPDQSRTQVTLRERVISGTPAYMAPEQAAGLPAVAASDFYALGVMMFEALTGRLPFLGVTAALLSEKQRSPAPAVRTFAPDSPEDLAELCDRLLQRDVSARPDAAALRAQLGEAAPGAYSALRSRSPRRAPARVSTHGAARGVSASGALLGRSTELAELRAAYESSLRAAPAVVFLSGASGMGKSALVAQFLDGLREEGHAFVLAGRCHERENVPFKGFDALIDALAQQLQRLSNETLEALLPREIYALARIFSVLHRVPAIAAAPALHVPDLQDLKLRAFAAFVELLQRVRARRPVVVFIDDLHWTDRDSVWFMRYLFTQAAPSPVMFICAHRSERAEENPALTAMVEAARSNPALQLRFLHVGPLPEGALQTLAHTLLDGAHDAQAEAALAREAQGSPFFTAELARAARLCAVGEPMPTLGRALSLHLGALPAAAQRLLSLLALVGQPLPPRWAIEAAEVSDGHALLDVLRAEQLIRVNISAEGVRSVECYHDKIRELSADTLDARTTRALWQALSHVLIRGGCLDAEILCRAHYGAGRPHEAASYAARAADQAYAVMAFDRAASLYSQALSDGSFAPERAQELRLNRAAALMRAGRGGRAAEGFLEAREHEDDARGAELTRLAGEQYLMCGMLPRGRALLALGLRRHGIALPTSAVGAFASVTWSRARLRLRGLSFVPREEHAPETLQKLEALRAATHCLLRSDQLRAADLCARWTLLALDTGHRVELARALSWEVMVAAIMQAPEARVEPVRALCEKLCEQTGDPLAATWLQSSYGLYLAVVLGRVEDAVTSYDRARTLLTANPYAQASHDRGWLEAFWVQSVLSVGRIGEAASAAQAGLDDALARGEHTVAVYLSFSLSIALLAADRATDAANIMESATELWLAPDVTVQDLMLVLMAPRTALYRNEPDEAWAVLRPRYERLVSAFTARVVYRGIAEQYCCGVAAAAALASRDVEERRSLTEAARALAERASRESFAGGIFGHAPAVLACLRGDRVAAIAALRAWLVHPQLSPVGKELTRRRLGELLANVEGDALIAQADGDLRRFGVRDPARFVAALYPGIALA